MPAINSVLDSGTNLLEAVLGGDETQIEEARTKLVEDITSLVQSATEQLPTILGTFGPIIQNIYQFTTSITSSITTCSSNNTKYS